jgi:hypothetical protein
LKEAYLKEQGLIDLNDKIKGILFQTCLVSNQLDTSFVQLTQTKNFDTLSLPNALEELCPGIKSQKMLIAGSPLIIIIAGTNLRVIEIAKYCFILLLVNTYVF